MEKNKKRKKTRNELRNEIIVFIFDIIDVTFIYIYIYK